MNAPLPGRRVPARWCGTRALKNARSLQQLLPREFPPLGVDECHLDRLPFEELLRLHHLTPPELDAVDPRLARLRAPIPGPGAVRGALFSGTLRFLHITYDLGPGGSLGVGPADLSMALRFAGLVSEPLQRYAGQYGTNRLDVAPAAPPARFPVPSGRFTDTTLQGWIGSLVRAGTVAAGECAVVLAPPGVVNADAPADRGVLGYHGHADVPYIFVNVLGTGFSLADPDDLYALALSHEIAEMLVDPMADGSNPEVCDPCGPNCQTALRDYFGSNQRYLGTTTAFPPAYSYAFYLNAVVQPASAAACPAPMRACAYSPP